MDEEPASQRSFLRFGVRHCHRHACCHIRHASPSPESFFVPHCRPVQEGLLWSLLLRVARLQITLRIYARAKPQGRRGRRPRARRDVRRCRRAAPPAGAGGGGSSQGGGIGGSGCGRALGGGGGDGGGAGACGAPGVCAAHDKRRAELRRCARGEGPASAAVAAATRGARGGGGDGGRRRRGRDRSLQATAAARAAGLANVGAQRLSQARREGRRQHAQPHLNGQLLASQQLQQRRMAPSLAPCFLGSSRPVASTVRGRYVICSLRRCGLWHVSERRRLRR